MNETIEVRTNYDTSTYLKFNRYHLFRKNTWLVLLPAVIFLLLGLLQITEGDAGGIIFIIAGIIFPLIVLLILPVSSRMHLKSDKIFSSMKNVYFRFNDETVYNEVKSPDLTNTTEFKWNKVYRIYESEDCFYIYISSRQVYIVPKVDIINGTAEDLRNLIKIKAEEHEFKVKLMR